jgi:hypothetical protein
LLSDVQLAYKVLDCIIDTLILLHDLPEHIQIESLYIFVVIIAFLDELQLRNKRHILLSEVPGPFILPLLNFALLNKVLLLVIKEPLLFINLGSQLLQLQVLLLHDHLVLVHLLPKSFKLFLDVLSAAEQQIKLVFLFLKL